MQNPQVLCMAVNIDGIRLRSVPKEVAQMRSLRHFYVIGEKAVNAYRVHFVPHRVLICAKGKVVESWDGSFGKVVEGRHGSSRRERGQLEEALDQMAAAHAEHALWQQRPATTSGLWRPRPPTMMSSTRRQSRRGDLDFYSKQPLGITALRK